MKRKQNVLLLISVVLITVFLGIPAWAGGEGITVYEENNSTLVFQGNWSNYGDSRMSGGNYKRSNTKDSTVSISFFGTGIKWIAATSSSYGLAEVILDGKTECTVDLYSSSTVYQQVVFQKNNLDRGNHTLVIRVTGNKSSGSSNSYICVDALKVIDSSDTEAPAAPTGLKAISSNRCMELFWGANSETDLEGYNIYRSTTSGSGFQRINPWLYFNGSSFTDTSVSNGTTYYYYVTAVDEVGNESAPSATVSGLPSFYTGLYQDNGLGMSYQGTWYDWGNSSNSGSNAKYSNAANNTVSFNFYGTGYKLLFYKDNSSGIVEVTTDKGLPTEEVETVDLYSATAAYQQNVYEMTGLSEGLHTVSIKITGQRNASSRGTYAYFDAVEVYGTVHKVSRIEESSDTIDKNGIWTGGSNNEYSGGYQSWTNRKGAGATYTFYGTGIDIISTKDTNWGFAKVTLDNEPPVLVNFYNDGWISQQRVFKRRNLTLGKHTIKIEALGTRVASSTDNYIGIDAIDIIDAVKIEKTTVPVSLAAEAGKGSVSLTWTSPAPQVVGYNVYRYRGILNDGKVNSGLVRTEAFTDTGLVPGVEYTYRVTAIDSLGNESDLSASVNVVPTVMGLGESVPVGTNALSAGNYEENNPAITYTGNWYNYSDSNASGNYYRRASDEGSTATVNFKGTGIKWISLRASNYGKAEVIIDGRSEGIVNLYSPSTEYKQVVYQKMNLANGWHTFQIKIPESGYVSLDGLTIVETDDVTAPVKPIGLTAVKGNTTVDLSWTANTDSDLEGYRIYRSESPDKDFSAVGSTSMKLVMGTQFKDTSLTNGKKYYYTVVAVDKYGNESQPSDIVSEIPAALTGIHQENNPGAVYSGSWSNGNDSRANGGAYRYTRTAGSTVSFTFYGTGIKWYSLLDTNRGIAEVTVKDLDGKVIKTENVDLYNASLTMQHEAFHIYNLPLGIYTIEIRNTGNRKASSSNTYIDNDCFEVLDTTDDTIPYAPAVLTVIPGSKWAELQWSMVEVDDLNGYNVYRSTSADGTYTKVNARVITGRTSYTDTTVSGGITYYYKVTAIDKWDNESEGSQIVSVLPAFYTGKYEDTDAGMAYEGTWYNSGNSGHSGSNVKYSNAANNTVSFNFYGTGYKLLFYKDNSSGIVEVTTDKGLPTEEVETVDLYSATAAYQQNVYEMTGLSEGLHTVSIKITGQRNASSRGTYAYFDAVEVYGTVHKVSRIEESSDTIDKNGIWTGGSNNEYSGGYQSWTNRKGAGATYTFYGTGIDIISTKDTNWGFAKVTLDNEPPVLVNFYNDGWISQQRVFKRRNLTLGKHTIKIEALGTRVASSTDNYIGIDAIDIIDAVKIEKTTVPVSLAAEAGKGSVSLTWTSPAPQVVGYNVYRYRGILNDGKVNSGLVRTEAFTDTGLVPGVEYTYRVTAIDSLGNESDLSASVNVVPTVMGLGESVPVGTNALSAGNYEENNPAITYTGNWYNYSDSNASGNYYRRASDEGSTATVNFKGTGIKWISLRASNYGKAEVIIDGRSEGIVNLYSPSTEYKQVVYQKMNLANGWHTFQIKIPESGYVSLDGLTIVETDDVTAPVKPIGLTAVKGNTTVDLSWTANTDSDLEGYRIYRSESPDKDFSAVGSTSMKLVMGTQFKDTSLTNGKKYYYTVVAVDKYGNESQPSDIVSEIPAALTGIHQENNPGAVYSGSWSNGNDSRANGGAYRYTRTAGSTVSFTFYGTGIKWYSLLDTNRGIAEVTVKDLDGKVIKTENVDLYNASLTMQHEAFHIYNLPLGIYTIEIRNTGNRKASSSNTYIDNDCFEVLDTTDDTIPYAPAVLTVIPGSKWAELQWSMVEVDDLNGYNVYRSTSADGTYTKVNARVITGRTSYTDTTVSGGITYYYKVTAIDKWDNESEGSQIVSVLPAFYTGKYEDTDAGMAYEGTWYNSGNSGHSGSNVKYSNAANNTVSFNFYGTGYKLLFYKDNSSGIVEVTTDKGLPTEEVETVDLYSATAAYQQNVYEMTGLSEGLHTVSIKITGQRNASSRGTYAYFDAVEVYGTVHKVSRIEESSDTIDKNGIWTGGSNNEYSGGYQSWTNRKGAGATYTFYGTGIDIISTKDTNWGFAKVTLDNEPPVLVNFYNDGWISQQRVFKRRNLTLGKHTIKIEALGTRVASSTDNYIGIDAIDIIDAVKIEKTTVPVSLAAEAGKGSVSLTWTSPAPQVVGYNVYRYRGILNDGKVNSGLVRTEAFTDTGLVPGVEYTYRVTAIDSLGNESDLSASVNVVPTVMGLGESVPVGTNALSAGNYEENNPAITYTGNWYNYSDSNASGNYYRRASDEGSTATVNFKGTGIKWISLRASNYGKAEVIIDGRSEGIVNLYSPSTEYKQVVYQKMNLANGWHTFQIKIPESGYVSLDGLIIVETDDVTAPAKPQSLTAVSGNTSISLSWSANTESDLDGYRIYRSESPDSGFSVIGSQALKLIKGSIEYTDTSLSNGKRYYYVITSVDIYGNESEPTTAVDNIPAISAGLVQENDIGAVYTGSWYNYGDERASGGNYRYNNREGDTFTITFYGTGAKYIAYKDSNYGKAEVYIDDVLMTTVDLYSASSSYQNIVWITTPPLTLGIHKLTIKNTGTKNPLSSGTYINVDAIEVMSSTETDAPNAPEGLTALFNTNENVLQWYIGSEDDLLGYNVYRSTTGEEESFVKVSQDPVRFASTYIDSGITSAAYYRVTAIDKNGNESVPSETVLSLPFSQANATVEDNSPVISYTGVWNRTSISGANDGYVQLTNDKPVKVTYSFYGTGLDLLARRAANYGTVLVKVDSGPAVKVDLYNPSVQNKFPVYRIRNLAQGMHTIEITNSDTNINSSDSYINIDAFKVVDAHLDKPASLTEITASSQVNKIMLLWNNVSDPDVVGYNVYYKTGALEYKKANLAGLVQSGFTHTGLTLSTTYTYIVKAVDSLGNEADASIEVNASTSESLIKALLQPGYTVEKGKTLIINAGNSYSADPPLTYNWDLDGDGVYDDATGIEAEVTFNDLGEYTIGLKVEDSVMRMDSTTTKVTVTAPVDKTPPTVPSNLMVITKTGSAVLLSWNISTDDIGVTGYEIFRDDISIGTTEKTTYTDENLTADTTYKYYVVAKDASGKSSSASNVIYVTPKMPKITAIEPISGATIGGKATKTLTLYFANNGGVVGSHASFEYSTDGKTWQPVNGTINGPYSKDEATLYYYSSFDITNMASGNYTIRYSLFDGSGNVDTLTAALKIDRTAPATPGNFVAEKDIGKINLSWEAPADEDVVYYKIFRSTSENGTYTQLKKINGMENVSYTDSSVTAGTTYYYKITAGDKFEQESEFSAVVSAASVIDNIKPVILGIEPVNDTVIGPNAHITVRAEDNLELSKITLQYSIDNVNWTDIETRYTHNNTVFSWSTSPINGTVKVRAFAYDTSGNVSDSVVRTYVVDNTGPSKVTDLTATVYTTGMTLHWKYSLDEDFSYFQVERKDSEDGQFKVIGTSSNVLGMEVTGLKPETSYWFRVVAYDKLGNRGTPSDEKEFATITDSEAPRITGLGPAPASFNKEIRLWGSASDNSSIKTFTFQMSRNLTDWTDIATIQNPGDSRSFTANYTYDITGLVEGLLYIRGVAKDASGNTSNTSSTASYVEYNIDRTAPSAPTGLATEPTAGYIKLTWNQGTELDIKTYSILKSDSIDGTYNTIAEGVSSLGYYDRNVEQGITYYYKVCAKDEAGNVGNPSDAVAGKLIADTVAPEILSISPKDQSTLPANPTINVLASDNYKLASIKLEYKKTGETQWSLVQSQPVTVSSQVVSFVFNTAGLQDGDYIFRATAVDSVGLSSTPKEVTYSLNILPPSVPSVTAKAGGWKAELTWTTGNEPDLAGFRVYRSLKSGGPYQMVRETTATVFSDTSLKPGVTYYYVVDSVDRYNNASRSAEVSVIPTNDDTNPPTADAGNDQKATTGIAVWFDGTMSSDNDRIASFFWDFGDGSTSSEAQPSHIYNNTGSYTVTLTVTDPAGNSSSDTAVITVVSPQKVGNMEVRVIDDETGEPLSGASVVVRYSDGTTTEANTNSLGVASIVAVPGEYKVYAYKTDYIPGLADATVELNKKTTATVKLKKGELVVGDLTVRRLTLQEIIDRGIDVTSPENQFIYKFEVHLAFNNVPINPPAIYAPSTGGPVVYDPITISDPTTSGGGTPGGTLKIYPVVIPHANHPEIRPTIAYMVVPGEARFLKEFFEVQLALENTADPEFVIQNSKALLKLPEGLSLAPTRETQSLEVFIGDFAGKEKKQIKWIIRGDQKGFYNLEADFTGILQPFGDPVKTTFKTKEPFRVWGEDALKMHVIAQDNAHKGYPYKVIFELENVSDIPVYYPAIELLDNDAKQHYIYAPNQNLVKSVVELPAKSKLTAEYTLIPAIDGNLDLQNSYVLKTGGNADIESDITSMHVPENNVGTAPILYQKRNSNNTVTLTWEKVNDATGYRIYKIRSDLLMSRASELVYEAGPEETTVTLPESGFKDYIITSIINDIEVMRHAITGLSWIGDTGEPAMTINPDTIEVNKNTELLITVNKNGFPVSDGTVDVGTYYTGVRLDNNGQARIFVKPTQVEDFTVTAYDASHNILVSKVVKVVSANRPAKGVLDTPKANASLTGSVNVSGWFIDQQGVSKIEVLIDGNVVGQAVYGDPRPDVFKAYPDYNNQNAGFHYTLDTTKLTPGSHTLRIRETSLTNVETYLNPINITVSLKPMGWIDSPKAEQEYSDKIDVYGWFLDQSGVSKVEVFVDDISAGTAVYGDPRADVKNLYPAYNNANSGFHYTLDISNLEAGSHTIKVCGTGNNGVITTLKPVTITVKPVTARGYMDVPGANAVLHGKVPVYGWFLDLDGVAKIEVLVDNVVVGQAEYGIARPDVLKAYPLYNNGNSGFQYILDASKLSEGTHVLAIRETSNSGRTTTLTEKEITVVYPVKGYVDCPRSISPHSGNVSVYGWILDNKQVEKVEVLVDGQPVGEATYGISRPDVLEAFPEYNNANSGFHYLLDSTTLTEGTHVLTIRETGRDGSQTLLPELEIIVSRLPVIGCIDKPAGSTAISGTVLVKGWVLDTSGVSKLNVLVDDVLVGEAVYGDTRADVTALHPSYNNNNSGFHFELDTSSLSNGTHILKVVEIGTNGGQTVLEKEITVEN
jgi:fibronectin type 3 domain-containing protein